MTNQDQAKPWQATANANGTGVSEVEYIGKTGVAENGYTDNDGNVRPYALNADKSVTAREYGKPTITKTDAGNTEPKKSTTAGSEVTAGEIVNKATGGAALALGATEEIAKAAVTSSDIGFQVSKSAENLLTTTTTLNKLNKVLGVVGVLSVGVDAAIRVDKNIEFMGIEKITQAVQLLIEFWGRQQLKFRRGNMEKIENLQKLKGYKLPSDFNEFYSRVNGMEEFYPNDTDEKGFLFYPIEAINPAITEFKVSQMENINNIFLFCEYMHRSWWYGCDVIDDDNYIIGIIPDKNSFKPICSSLAEFIELYVNDSSVLYDYR